MARYLYGPLTRLGLIAAAIACALDQAAKLWLLYGFDLASRTGYGKAYELGSFFALVLTKNYGISYGLFPQDTDFGRYTLLALKAAAVIILWVWLARAETKLTALSLGLIIGGAFGNAIDRLAYGWVMDFAWFHIDAIKFSWYVFNLADAAIVAGVVGLLYESFFGGHAAKAP